MQITIEQNISRARINSTKQASLVFSVFCAQIQLLKVDSIIAFKREGASFPLHSKSLPSRPGCLLVWTTQGKCLLAGLAIYKPSGDFYGLSGVW